MNDFGQRIAQLSPKKLAVLAMQLQNRLQELECVRNGPIAIIGTACRFPGASNPAEYWQLLSNGQDQITEVPARRWDLDAYYDPDPDAPGKMYTRHGGFIESIDEFDPEFFNISPREAVSMDPQQRLLLEVCWEALENAGLAVDRLGGSATGVFMGTSGSNYSAGACLDDLSRINAYTGTGNISSIAAGRISYLLGLQGPSMPVDTSCSSSLVAVHLACQSLRSGESDLALAGGVNLILAPEPTIYFCKVRVLSPDGRCKTFDAAANGYVRGEGCGVLVLKRLADAQAASDPILAIIRGTAVNHGGRSNGLIVPNKVAQEAVIRAALANAGLRPDDVQYVEAQGTATSLGDPVEVLGLGSVFGGRPADQPLLIGTAKANIGHLEAAAGAAGLIKAVEAIRHGQVPPQLHFSRPNPYIPWDRLPLRVPTSLTDWPAAAGSRRCGVSAFGFSGTNCHIIVEQAPAEEARLPENGTLTPERPLHLLCISARSEAALLQLANRMVEYLDSDATPAWPDVCHTALVGRSHFSHRLALTASRSAEARELLAAFVAGRPAPGLHRGELLPTARLPRVTFAFPGPETFDAGMGRQLFQSEPRFRKILDQCAELSRQQGLASPGAGVKGQSATTLFALQYALGRLWQAWGIEPAALVGQGAGELAAACLAGVFSLEDGLRLAAAADNPASVARQITYHPPRFGLVSSVTGCLESTALTRAEYWAEAVRPRTRFAEAVQTLTARGYELLIVLGARPADWHSLGKPPAIWLEALEQGKPEWQSILGVLAQLYVRGVAVDGTKLGKDDHRRRVVLPNYPFQRQRYWNDRPSSQATAPVETRNGDGLHTDRRKDSDELRVRLAQVPAGEHPALLTDYLRGEVARALHLVSPAAVDVRRPILDLGLDSLMLVGLRDDLEALRGQALPPTLLIENPSIAELATYLSQPTANGSRTPAVLEQVEQLPEIQAETMLVRYRQAVSPQVRQRLDDLSSTKRELLLLRLAQAGPDQEPAAAEEKAEDLEAEAILDAAIRRPPGPPAPAEPTALLLTGATGFLGAHLLHDLLTQTRAVVYCLVRAADANRARARVEETLRAYGLDAAASQDRLISLVGELDQPLLGLDERTFNELAERTDAIYHCGAVVHFLQPYHQLRAANVGGSIEALRLAARGRAKRFHLVSSITVYAALDYLLADQILEDAPLTHSAGLVNGYARSKWVSDKLTTAARERHLETIVYRPGLIAGHTRTGQCKVDDLLPRLIKGCIQVGCAPVLDGVPVDFTPVDFVSRAIVHLSRQPSSANKAFNFLHPSPLSWNELIDEVRAYGYAVRSVDYPEWVDRLNQSADNELRPLQMFYEHNLAGSFRLPPLDDRNTKAGLAGAVTCPPMRELVRTYLSHFVRCGYLPPP